LAEGDRATILLPRTGSGVTLDRRTVTEVVVRYIDKIGADAENVRRPVTKLGESAIVDCISATEPVR
jgi:hypothetical protein